MAISKLAVVFLWELPVVLTARQIHDHLWRTYSYFQDVRPGTISIQRYRCITRAHTIEIWIAVCASILPQNCQEQRGDWKDYHSELGFEGEGRRKMGPLSVSTSILRESLGDSAWQLMLETITSFCHLITTKLLHQSWSFVKSQMRCNPKAAICSVGYQHKEYLKGPFLKGLNAEMN